MIYGIAEREEPEEKSGETWKAKGHVKWEAKFCIYNFNLNILSKILETLTSYSVVITFIENLLN